MKNYNVRIVIHIHLFALLSPKDHLIISKILFANDVNKSPDLLALIHKLCMKTRVKMTFKDEDDGQDELLIYWKNDSSFTTFPRFESKLFSVYNEREDNRQFKLLNQNKHFQLIGTNTVSVLSRPAQLWLKYQLDEYLNHEQTSQKIPASFTANI